PVLLLHGIWSTGRRDVQRYGPHLHRAGFEILDAQQRFAFLWETWLKPERDAECAARLVEAIGATRPHLIAHSNGCRIAALAMARGARFGRVLFLGPPWPAPAPYPPAAFRRPVVAHSRFDMRVWIGGLLPRHQFGWLGRLGY